MEVFFSTTILSQKVSYFFFDACTFAPVRRYPYLASHESWQRCQGTAAQALGRHFINEVIISRV